MLLPAISTILNRVLTKHYQTSQGTQSACEVDSENNDKSPIISHYIYIYQTVQTLHIDCNIGKVQCINVTHMLPARLYIGWRGHKIGWIKDP